MSIDREYNIMVSGIGGTGVVTVGALLAMAAHLEGKACSVFDMTGLSQKNGAVFSHVRIASDPSQLGAQKLAVGDADLALAFDAVAALAKEPSVTFDPERTRTVVNLNITPTPAFQRNPDLTIDRSLLLKRLERVSREVRGVDATGLGLALLGDTIAANLFLLGYASQTGLLPVGPAAIERAVEINGVSILFNKAAFALGRLQAVDPARIAGAAAENRPIADFKPLTELPEILEDRIRLLSDYQNAAYAKRYRILVDEVSAAEERALPGSTALSVMVARNMAKLMAYKDEYEVARLHADPVFRAELAATFEDGAKIRYNLAPPLFSKRDPQTGHLQKREFGAWMGAVFSTLAKFKRLRGTVFDVFGRTAERKIERSLIDHYERQMRMVAEHLTPHNHKVGVELASLPAQIRGYGHVKEANVEKVRAIEPHIVERFMNSEPFAVRAAVA